MITSFASVAFPSASIGSFHVAQAPGTFREAIALLGKTATVKNMPFMQVGALFWKANFLSSDNRREERHVTAKVFIDWEASHAA
jgi:hypothetical protein